jgi:hypothetical protein
MVRRVRLSWLLFFLEKLWRNDLCCSTNDPRKWQFCFRVIRVKLSVPGPFAGSSTPGCHMDE